MTDLFALGATKEFLRDGVIRIVSCTKRVSWIFSATESRAFAEAFFIPENRENGASPLIEAFAGKGKTRVWWDPPDT